MAIELEPKVPPRDILDYLQQRVLGEGPDQLVVSDAQREGITAFIERAREVMRQNQPVQQEIGDGVPTFRLQDGAIVPWCDGEPRTTAGNPGSVAVTPTKEDAFKRGISPGFAMEITGRKKS